MYLVYLTVFIIGGVMAERPLADESKVLSKLLPSVPTFADLATKNGFPCEEYDVTTSDGYILKLFRIVRDVQRPVLLMHGILDSSDAFIIRENTSLSLTLAREGYDVWAGNARGNRYSRRHIKLDPDTEAEFWDFSFHEIGSIDVATMIDFVLASTGQQQLSAVAHSQGTTSFFVLGALKPEYNAKIKVFAALAPIVYLQNSRGLLPTAIIATAAQNTFLDAINYQEFIGFNSTVKSIARWVCEVPITGYDLCYKGIFPLIGPDTAQIGPDIMPTILEHFPAGASKKCFIHYTQVFLLKSFAQYDYGPEKNLELYESLTPPKYNLSNVKFDVGMYIGANDYATSLEDVAILRKQLPQVVDYQVLAFPLWNHLDHLYGKDMNKYLFPFVKKLLGQYE